MKVRRIRWRKNRCRKIKFFVTHWIRENIDENI